MTVSDNGGRYLAAPAAWTWTEAAAPRIPMARARRENIVAAGIQGRAQSRRNLSRGEALYRERKKGRRDDDEAKECG